jgi:hypothetical protein
MRRGAGAGTGCEVGGNRNVLTSNEGVPLYRAGVRKREEKEMV